MEGKEIQDKAPAVEEGMSRSRRRGTGRGKSALLTSRRAQEPFHLDDHALRSSSCLVYVGIVRISASILRLAEPLLEITNLITRLGEGARD